MPTPGEVTLAHRGVLFLDELSEFPRNVLEGLRQPLEDGEVTVVRTSGRARYPAVVTLVAATNPCPCGFAGDGSRCSCDPAAIERHSRRLSGPLLDRFDLLATVRRPSSAELLGDAEGAAITTSEARERVELARAKQTQRWSGEDFDLNAEASATQIDRAGALAPAAVAAVTQAYERGLLSPRGRLRVMRVARTVADLEDSAQVEAAPDVATVEGFRWGSCSCTGNVGDAYSAAPKEDLQWLVRPSVP